MQPLNIEKYLDDLAVIVAKQEDRQFATAQEAQNHVKATSAKLQDLLKQSSTLFLEGLHHLASSQYGIVAEISARLIKHLNDPAKLIEIMQSEIAEQPRSLELFSEAVNSYYDCGDYHREESVIAVLLTLFPMEPQPLACYGTMLWRRDGIETAAEFYQNIVNVLEDPILDYFAADCFYKSGKKAEAKPLLERALRCATEEPDVYHDIAQFIRVLLKQM